MIVFPTTGVFEGFGHHRREHVLPHHRRRPARVQPRRERLRRCQWQHDDRGCPLLPHPRTHDHRRDRRVRPPRHIRNHHRRLCPLVPPHRPRILRPRLPQPRRPHRLLPPPHPRRLHRRRRHLPPPNRVRNNSPAPSLLLHQRPPHPPHPPHPPPYTYTDAHTHPQHPHTNPHTPPPPPALTHWLPALLLAVALRPITHRWTHQLVFPGYFLLIPLTFYAIVFAAGIDMQTLRREGWVFDVGGGGVGGGGGGAGAGEWYAFWGYFDIHRTSWRALWVTLPTQFALLFFNILHPPLNVPALGTCFRALCCVSCLCFVLPLLRPPCVSSSLCFVLLVFRPPCFVLLLLPACGWLN
ncbi:hypothetical protein K439DRAFT_882681 [Ramaria rubella]|nr:hypothetical protein K439DRAFT_882681 [Ramaria rubella]